MPERKGFRWKRALIIVLAVVAVVLLVARCQQKGPEAAKPAPQAMHVQTIRLANQSIQDRLFISGSLAARHELPITAELSGLRILKVLVEEGDWVKAGQSLAVLDTSLLTSEQAQRRAAVAQQRASLQEAESYLNRLKPLAGSGAVSAQEVESREVAVATARANLAAAEAQLAETRTRLKQAALQSPADARVGQRNAEPGQLTAIGADPLFRLIEEGEVEMIAQIPEADLARLQVGQAARIWVGQDQTKAVAGSLRLIRPLIDPQTRLGLVRVSLPKDEPSLRPGAFARGELALAERPALTVPLAALTYEDGRPFITLVDDKNFAQRQAVTLGARQDQWAEILEGAKEGDRIVAKAANFLRSGDLVQPVEDMHSTERAQPADAAP